MWTEFLPNAKISFVEYDALCANKWRENIEKAGRGQLYVGDQGNKTFLNDIIDDQHGALFDVVIDDGGHYMHQQILTVQMLWKLVVPGGIFVMEDLETSFDSDYGGGPKGTPNTMLAFHKDMLDGFSCGLHTNCIPPLEGLLDLDCFRESCVMVKAR